MKKFKPIKFAREFISKQIFKHQMKQEPFPIKLVVGASGDRYPGWISTEESYFDITNEDHWDKYFHYDQPVWNEKTEKWESEPMPVISRILAEHVFEHLDEIAIEHTLKLMHKYLVIGGRIRIAMPDPLHTNKKYLEYIRDPIHNHITELSAIQLARKIKAAGFENVQIKEGFNDAGFFNVSTWYRVDGYVKRSFWYDARNMLMDDGILWTSVIVDGIKQPIIKRKGGLIL